MNSQNSRYLLDFGKPEDNEQILEILEENDFKGSVSLLYTRRPDAYSSFMAEGDDVIVMCCRDTHRGRLAGIGICAVREFYVNGKILKAGYLLGLRVRKEYRKTYAIIPKGYDFLFKCARSLGVTSFYTTILKDNTEAQKLLEKPRNIIPNYVKVDDYRVFAYRFRAKNIKNTDFSFKRATKDDEDELIFFLNKEGAKMNMFPVLAKDFLIDDVPGKVGINDFFILKLGNTIVAAGALWNQKNYKQYVLKGYRGIMKAAYKISPLLRFTGLPKLPKEGEILDFYTLSFWAVKDCSAEYFKLFIDEISALHCDFEFFLLGMPMSNPLFKIADKKPHVSYESKLYSVNYKGGTKINTDIDNVLPLYLECALL